MIFFIYFYFSVGSSLLPGILMHTWPDCSGKSQQRTDFRRFGLVSGPWDVTLLGFGNIWSLVCGSVVNVFFFCFIFNGLSLYASDWEELTLRGTWFWICGSWGYVFGHCPQCCTILETTPNLLTQQVHIFIFYSPALSRDAPAELFFPLLIETSLMLSKQPLSFPLPAQKSLFIPSAASVA